MPNFVSVKYTYLGMFCVLCRYAFPPHMSPIRLRHCTQDYDSASFQRPCPSPVFQQHVAEQLTQDDDTMQQFINRLTFIHTFVWIFEVFGIE